MPNRTHADEAKGLMVSVRAFEGLVRGVGIVATIYAAPWTHNQARADLDGNLRRRDKRVLVREMWCHSN